MELFKNNVGKEKKYGNSTCLRSIAPSPTRKATYRHQSRPRLSNTHVGNNRTGSCSTSKRFYYYNMKIFQRSVRTKSNIN